MTPFIAILAAIGALVVASAIGALLVITVEGDPTSWGGMIFIAAIDAVAFMATIIYMTRLVCR